MTRLLSWLLNLMWCGVLLAVGLAVVLALPGGALALQAALRPWLPPEVSLPSLGVGAACLLAAAWAQRRLGAPPNTDQSSRRERRKKAERSTSGGDE